MRDDVLTYATDICGDNRCANSGPLSLGECVDLVIADLWASRYGVPTFDELSFDAGLVHADPAP